VVAVGRELQRDVPGPGADVEHAARAGGEGGGPQARPRLALLGVGQAGELVLVVLGRVPGPVRVPALLLPVEGVGEGQRSSCRIGTVRDEGDGGGPPCPRNRNCTTPSSAVVRCASTS